MRGEVVYSIVVPETRELLAAARMVLRELLADQAELERALQPTMWDPAPPAGGPGDARGAVVVTATRLVRLIRRTGRVAEPAPAAPMAGR